MAGLRAFRFQIPLKMAFGGLTERHGLIFRGPAGLAEYSPLPDMDEEARLRALAGVSELLLDPVQLRQLRDRIEVNVTVPAVAPEAAAELVRESDCTTAKVKVGDAGSSERVAAVRDALGSSGKLRVDCNGAWSVDEALKEIKRLSSYDLEFVEQPVASLEEMADLRKKVDVPIAADELVRSGEKARQIAKSEAADILVIKVQYIGGISEAMQAADTGLPIVVSSPLETSVGIATGARFAASLPDLPYACGLGTASLLESDVVVDPLLPKQGHILVRDAEIDSRRFERTRR